MRGGVKDGAATDFYEFYDSGFQQTDELNIKEETIPFDFGAISGQRKMYHFEGGAIFHITMNVKEDYKLVAVNEPLVKIHFCLKGEKTTGIEADNKVFFVKQNQNNLYYFPAREGYFDLKKGQYLEYVDICLDIDFFKRITGNYGILFDNFRAAINENKFFQLSEMPLQTSLRMKAVLNEVLNCKPVLHIKKPYFIHKLVELMLLQAEETGNGFYIKKKKYICKTPQDYQKLEQAKLILTTHYAHPPSLLNLAKQVGVNDNKLKRGFKELYGNTIMAYLTDFKLNMASDLLKSKKYSVTEVCSSLGYKSLAHFSRLFKKKFNINPSDMSKHLLH